MDAANDSDIGDVLAKLAATGLSPGSTSGTSEFDKQVIDDDSDKDSTDDGANDSLMKINNLSAKRNAENLVFSQWMREKQKEIYDDACRTYEAGGRGEGLAHGATKIITSPREYQMELFERAKQRNTIAVLPTGQCLLCHHMMNESANLIQ